MTIAIAPNWTHRDYFWTAWKAIQAVKKLIYQYDEDSDVYLIYGYDNPEVIKCMIWKGQVPGGVLAVYSQEQNDLDKADFEDNWKAGANRPLVPIDTDGAHIVRNKAAKQGWTFGSVPFEFETARLSDSLYSKESDGTSRSFITLKAYNASGDEVTTAGLLGANYATIVKTVIDFEPPYDYEVVGGDLRTLTSIDADMRLWIIAVPDISAGLGGSKEMGGGINLRYLSPGNVWQVDGRVAKYATYSATYHTNKLRMILKYPAGTNELLQIIIQLYRA